MKNTPTIITTLLLTLFSLSNSFANKDSLWTIWEDESQVDTVRLDALYNFTAKYYLYNHPDSAITFFKNYLAFAETIENERKIAVGLRLVGAAYQVSGDREICLDYYEKSYEKSIKVNDMDGAIKSLLNKNQVYRSLGRWEEVIQDLEQLIPKLKADKDWDNLIIAQGTLLLIYNNQGRYEQSISLALENYALRAYATETRRIELMKKLAMCYKDIKEFDLAIKYYKEALELAEKLNQRLSIFEQLDNIVDIKIEQKDTTDLTFYITKGEILANEFEGTYKWVTWKYQLSEYYMEQGLFQKADTLLKSALSVAEEKNFDALKIYIDHAIGINAIDLKDFDKAISFCNQSYIDSKERLQSKELMQLNCDCLHKAYKAIGQPARALPYLEESYALRDSLFNEETTKATTRLTMQYEFDQEKQETERLYQSERQRQRFIQYGLIGGLSLLGLLAFVIYRNYRNKAKANQLIEAQKNKLEELNATKDRLFAIIGHDLRKPSIAFRGIGKKVDYLLQQQDYDTLGKLSQNLEKAAFSLNSLLDNLLNWALQQRNVLPYQPQAIHIAKATEEIYQQFQTVAVEKGVDLQFDLSEDTQIFADPNAFTTIVRNLVDNAIKFTPEQGSVELSDVVQNEQVVLKVQDTGIGIATDELDHLFQLKGKKSRKGTNGEAGTGLGLTLVQELVKMNKGRIAVESQLNQGTIFQIALPMVK